MKEKLKNLMDNRKHLTIATLAALVALIVVSLGPALIITAIQLLLVAAIAYGTVPLVISYLVEYQRTGAIDIHRTEMSVEAGSVVETSDNKE